LFWYQIYANFDCVYLYDYTYIVMFNLAFTSLPIILMGVLDQDVDDKVSLANPQLYRRGIERLEWTQKKFWLYMLDALYQSILVFWSAYLLFSPANTVTHNGLGISDVKRMGVYVAVCAVMIVNSYVLFNTYRWDWLTLLIQAISVLLFFFWTGVWTSSPTSVYFYKAAEEVFGQLSFWVLLAVVIVIALLPRFTIKSAQKVFFPRDVDIIREQVRMGKFDYLKDSDDLFPPNPNKVHPVDRQPSTLLPPGALTTTVNQTIARSPTPSTRASVPQWPRTACPATCSGTPSPPPQTTAFQCPRGPVWSAHARHLSAQGSRWTVCVPRLSRATTSRRRPC
jgi:phospholipid-translocating ATPase